jgi:hypothetical protein
MRFSDLNMPDGWPWSLWFFVATAVVYLLQRFPPTGIFLMLFLAMFWSVILVNAGFIGIGIEALTGRVSLAWLLLPLLYFGGYYAFYAKDQAALAAARAHYAKFNSGKSLPFDPARQDVIFEKGKGDFHPTPQDFVRRFGLKRAFDANGLVHFIGDKDACALVRGNDVYRSAGIYSFGFQTEGDLRHRQFVKGYCLIYAPGTPDRAAVRVVSDDASTSSWGLPVRKQELHVRDEASGRETEIWAARASPLPAFPMPVMGCGLNSGNPSWDCFTGFYRRSFVPIMPRDKRFGGSVDVLASALGLRPRDDYAAIAAGPEVVTKLGEAADAALIRKETAKLEQMLAHPEEDLSDGWFWHLPNRPPVVAPYADRIFGALGTLQNSDIGGSNNGRNLWRLAAVLPEEALAPHRAQLVEWLRPDNARAWTKSSSEIYPRLDAADPVQAEIMLERLETDRGELQTRLLPQFCRMGPRAPDGVKQRLLALWRQRGQPQSGRSEQRAQTDLILYVTLARMGLKKQAGKVEQRYYGPTFEGVWNEVTPDTPADICDSTVHDLSTRYRRR